MVAVLQCDEARFQWPQHRDGAAEDQRCPQHEVDPDRRRKTDFDERRQADDDQAQKKDDKNGRAITRILGGQVEAAHLALSAHVQQPDKQPALAATRAPAAECGAQPRDRRKLIHPTTPAPPLPSPHQ